MLSTLQPHLCASWGASMWAPDNHTHTPPPDGGETEARGVRSLVRGCRAGSGARKVSRNRWAGPDVPWDSRPRRLGGQPPGQGPQDRSWDSASRPLSCSQQTRAGGDRGGGQALRVSSTLGCLSQQVCSEASTGQGCRRGPHATPG